jgi:hypothetical protein
MNTIITEIKNSLDEATSKSDTTEYRFNRVKNHKKWKILKRTEVKDMGSYRKLHILRSRRGKRKKKNLPREN